MSAPFDHHLSATSSTVVQDPFTSPDFHLRNCSLGSAAHVPGVASTPDSSPIASASQRRRSSWLKPSSGRLYQIWRLNQIPLRWFAVLLCLSAAVLVWHLPPPLTRHVSLYLDQHHSISAPQILRPLDSGRSPPTDPEKWLRENSKEVSLKGKWWWETSSAKPRGAIISLVRNEELEGIMQSMRQLEFHWNRKYNYPWIFFNEKPFSDEFKVPSQITVAEVC